MQAFAGSDEEDEWSDSWCVSPTNTDYFSASLCLLQIICITSWPFQLANPFFSESGFSALTLKLAHKIPGILKRAVSGRWVMWHQPHIIVPKDVFMYGRIRLWQFQIAFVFLYSLTVRRNRLFETPNHLVSWIKYSMTTVFFTDPWCHFGMWVNMGPRKPSCGTVPTFRSDEITYGTQF